MKLLAVFGRIPLIDRFFIPLALVMAVVRVVDGLNHGIAWSFAAGLGFACYGIGKFLQYWYADIDDAPPGVAAKLQMGGIGLWLASIIWRFKD